MRNPAIAIFLASTCLLATGCTTAPPAPEPRTVNFACDNGPRLTVVFADDIATVTPEGGSPIVLPQAPSGSGFLYATPQHSLRGKGDDVTWTVGRMVAIQCKVAG